MNKSQLQHLVVRLRASAFLGNVSKLVSGEVISQVVAMLSIPLLTRLYGPGAFGILGVFIAISEIGGKVSILRYDVALVLPKEDREGWALLRFSALWAVVFTLVILLGTYPYRHPISEAFGTAALAQYFPYLALMILAIGWQSLGSFWAMREKAFKAIAQGSAGSSIIGNAVKVGVGLLGFGAGGLLLGTVVQRWSNLIFIRLLTPERIWRHETVKGEACRQAILYQEFPKYRMPQDSLNAFTRHLPSILLAAFFDPVAAGFYILATRILQLPFSLLQGAVRKVFYIKAVETHRVGDSLFRICSNMSLLIFATMLPAVFITIGWGGMLCEFAFGSEWGTTGVYAKWVIVSVLFSFTSLPSSVVIPIMGWNRFYLIFEVISTVLYLSIIVAVASELTAHATVVAISLSAAASNLILTCVVLGRLRRVSATQVDPAALQLS